MTADAREQLLAAQNMAWAVSQPRLRVTLTIIGGALLAFGRDTSSGAPAEAPAALSPIRRLAIDAARGALPAFSWWSLER